jgi:hypothetical protein
VHTPLSPAAALAAQRLRRPPAHLTEALLTEATMAPVILKLM